MVGAGRRRRKGKKMRRTMKGTRSKMMNQWKLGMRKQGGEKKTMGRYQVNHVFFP
jgi:hypothetical protein